MPEIAEVARIVSILKKHITNLPIIAIHAQDDPIVYGKVGTSAEAFKTALTGRTIVDVKQQGKYFWFELDKPPHILMHFGMTGWIRMKDVYTPYWEPEAKGKSVNESWPPRFEKWRIEFEGGVEAAFCDPRRLGRIRLVDVEATDMRKTTPLKENGPDPHLDKDVFTKEWLRAKLRSKKVPVKALLLDQANISGIGNWVGYVTCDMTKQY
jgi:formamidopyrimidine-DNA glycosylase